MKGQPDEADDPGKDPSEHTTRAQVPSEGEPRSGTRRWSIAPRDLSQDAALKGCTWVEFEGEMRPSLGRMVLFARIGAGGMGVVYFGVNPRLGTEVAVKVLPHDVLERGKGVGERFEREARYAARLRSPHLVAVTEVDRDAPSGAQYIVMEFVHGTSGRGFVADRFSSGQRVTETEALDLCIAAAKGLQAAHADGIVHRDVKPDNILIPCDPGGRPRLGEAKLADLGVARADATIKDLTATSVGLGTLGYMAPEQAKDAKRAGKPADVFGLGATLYALLTGAAPFTGPTAHDAMMNTVLGRYPPIGAARPGTSDSVAELVRRCLATEPLQRYADATALLDALESCRRELSAADAPPSTPSARGDSRRREVSANAPIVWTAVGAGVLTAGLLALAWHLREDAPPEDPAPHHVAPTPVPEAPEPVRFGTLDLSQLPAGVSAWTGGELVTDGAERSPGRHVVLLKRDGFVDQEVTVDVVAAESFPVVCEPWTVLADAARRLLSTLDAWNGASAQEHEGAARHVASRTPGFAFDRLETFDDGGRSHELAVFVHSDTRMEFVLLPAGDVVIGSPEGEFGRDPADEDQVSVTLESPFLIARTEVTQIVWEQHQPDNPSKFHGSLRPVESVTWDEATGFCTRRGLELPSEAQWEFACRAGGSTAFCFGEDPTQLGDYAWSLTNSAQETHLVAQKRANAFGLYDVHGNVWEWCRDLYGDRKPMGKGTDKFRVLRGGGWNATSQFLRCAYRIAGEPRQARLGFLGMRPVRTISLD